LDRGTRRTGRKYPHHVVISCRKAQFARCDEQVEIEHFLFWRTGLVEDKELLPNFSTPTYFSCNLFQNAVIVRESKII